MVRVRGGGHGHRWDIKCVCMGGHSDTANVGAELEQHMMTRTSIPCECDSYMRIETLCISSVLCLMLYKICTVYDIWRMRDVSCPYPVGADGKLVLVAHLSHQVVQQGGEAAELVVTQRVVAERQAHDATTTGRLWTCPFKVRRCQELDTNASRQEWEAREVTGQEF